MKYLIPLSYLNEACAMSTNIDEKRYKFVLRLAQNNLKAILGTEFYNEIYEQYEVVNDTFTTDNANLYEECIKDFLAWRTYYEHLRFSQSQSTPTGEREFNDDNSTILSDIRLNSIQKNVLKEADNYKFALINYIKEAKANDSTKYLKYTDSCKKEFSYGFSCVERDSTNDKIISINKTVNRNE